MFKTIFRIFFSIIFGALGALLFVVFLLPWAFNNPYFQDYQFVKDLKQGKLVVNQKESVYIQENTALQDGISKVKSSVVIMQSPTLSLASGLVATSDGNIITLASAVAPGSELFLNGQPVPFTVVKKDGKNNLALLKVDKNNLQTVSFASSDSVKLGQRVFLTSATSSAMDNWFANEGIISEIDATVLPGAAPTIKTNIIERPIANGSPLFNSTGELVGLTIVDKTGTVSVIPISSIKDLLGL